MKNRIMKAVSLSLVCLLALTGAVSLADVASFEVDGTVISIAETPVASTYSGTVDTVYVREGDTVSKGDTIATLKTTKVYAGEDGTVRLFGSVGDSASMVTDRYGAVAYVEPELVFTISGSTKYAYSTTENKLIHPGETVYLRSKTSTTHKGTGVVTEVSGTSYTVEVLDGNLEISESINIYRDETYLDTSRIGRGSTSRVEYSAYEGSGVIVRYGVKNGAAVKKGDLLFETVEGDYAGDSADIDCIKATADGVIGSLSISNGSSVTAGDTVCTLYPDGALRIEASVDEESLAYMPVGTAVKISFSYFKNGSYTLEGVVESLSAVGSEDESSDSDASYFKAIIEPASEEGISYGLTVTVSNG